MVIGIDASRAFVRDKTGTENYSYNLINAIVRLPESRMHSFVLFIRPNAVLPKELALYSNVIVKEVKWPYLWTQVGLAIYTWRKFQIPTTNSQTNPNHQIQNSKRELDVLWIPAHTLPVLRNPRIKTVVTIHGLEYQWLPEYKNWLQKWYLPLSTFYAANSANRLIAVSKFTGNQLKKELHTSSEKIKVIHEGVELNKLTNQQTNVTTEKVLHKFALTKKQYVLFVGSVQPRKNLVALVEAYSQFVLQYPDLPAGKAGYKLVIAGGIGWMAEEVLRAPGKYGVEEKVIFTGRITDLELAQLYSGAIMYIQPSITEGFGLPVLEAMAAGVPVLSSDGGALGEVVGTAGMIIKLGSGYAERLAAAMKRVVGESSLRAEMIMRGKKRAGEFSWEKAAKSTLKVLLNA